MASVQQPFDPASRDDAEAAFRLPIGAASPLWFAFGAAAAGASAWWWMTRWAREGAAVAVETLRPPEPASFAADETEEATQAVEAVAEDAGLVIDPLVEAPVVVAPIPETPAALVETVTQAAPKAVEKTVEASKAAADDLTRLVGIGPKLAAALAERGINRFEQIAAWQAKELDEIDKALSLKGRATREAWVSQARRLAVD